MNISIKILSVLLGLSALINWWAAYTTRRRVYIITKPLVMILWIILFIGFNGYQGDGVWFLLALLFSLAGDILLLFSLRWFIMGLYTFFFAQVAYIIGFNQVLPSWQLALAGIIIVAVIVSVVGLVLRKYVTRKPEIKKMVLPILSYAAVLSMMALSAVMSLFKPEWSQPAAWMAAIGGTLFLCSDLMLAYDRFIHRFKHAQALVIVTYHLAQFGLTLGYLSMAGLLKF